MPTTITKPQHHTTIRVFCVAEIQRNPFRDIERYPLEEKKIEALCESIRTTGFWDNVVARIGEDGKPEIVYGHHRLDAVHRVLGDDAKVGLIIRELDDETMLQMMVEENMQEWSTSATVEQESVRAVILAYGAGKIKLPRPDPKASLAKLRFAPSFLQGGDDPNVHLDHKRRRYTSATVAKFMGWQKEKVRIVLQALELMELDMLRPNMFKGLGPTKARALVEGVLKVAQEMVYDVPKSWKADNNKPRVIEVDRRLLRKHVEQKVAAWRAAEGNYTQGFDPMSVVHRNVDDRGPHTTPIRVKLCRGKKAKSWDSSWRDRNTKTLLEHLWSPAKQYPDVVARFIQAMEDLVEQTASGIEKTMTAKERRRVHQLLAQVRKVVDTVEVTLKKERKKGVKKVARPHRGKVAKARAG